MLPVGLVNLVGTTCSLLSCDSSQNIWGSIWRHHHSLASRTHLFPLFELLSAFVPLLMCIPYMSYYHQTVSLTSCLLLHHPILDPIQHHLLLLESEMPLHSIGLYNHQSFYHKVNFWNWLLSWFLILHLVVLVCFDLWRTLSATIAIPGLQWFPFGEGRYLRSSSLVRDSIYCTEQKCDRNWCSSYSCSWELQLSCWHKTRNWFGLGFPLLHSGIHIESHGLRWSTHRSRYVIWAVPIKNIQRLYCY